MGQKPIVGSNPTRSASDPVPARFQSPGASVSGLAGYSEMAAYLYDATGHDREIPLDITSLPDLAADQLLWVDLERSDTDSLATICILLALDGDTLDATTTDSPRTQVLRFPSHFHFALTIAPDHGERGDRRIDFLVSKSWLLTIRDGDVGYFTDFRDKDRAETDIGALSPAVLTASLLDWHLDSYFNAIGHIESAIDGLDEATLAERTGRSGLARLAVMRRRVSGLRRRLADQRGVFYGLARPDFDPVVSANAVDHFHHVERRFDRTVDQLDAARQGVAGAFDLFETKTAQETNELVKRLTFVTVVIGFASAIAGIFGMNFETSFGKTGEHGFHIVIGMMVVTAIRFTVVARARKWI